MEVIFSEEVLGPLPPSSLDINVNHCKNPACANFGVPAVLTKWARRKGTTLATTPGSAYSLTGAGKQRPALKCLLCGEIFSIKSNLAVAEELIRFTKFLLPGDAVCCSTEFCINHTVPIGTPKAYQRYGTTKVGATRWKCKICGKTFAVGGPALKRQRITHQNKTIFLALTNKMPLRRILKFTGLNAVTLYSKIDFIHRQCLAFAGSRERGLRDLAPRRLYISVDRQDYTVNWSRDVDRRNIVLHAMGSADNTSGYVFGMHLNFDAEVNSTEVEMDAAKLKESTKPYPHRKYARLWLLADYDDSLKQAEAEKARATAKYATKRRSNNLSEAIQDAYEASAIREDPEASETKDMHLKLPDTHGMQVHEEYSMYAHFFYLKQMLRWAGKIRFFLDQDSGMRAACLSAFHRDIKLRRVDAFFVRTAKEMTIDQKRGAMYQAKAFFNQMKAANPKLSEDDVRIDMMKAEISRAVALGKWSDRWCLHPLPSMTEPKKAVCWLTDIGDLSMGMDVVPKDWHPPKQLPVTYGTVPTLSYEDHRARLFLKASLAGIDNFFQRVRRSINPLERPLQTASSARRVWHGYSPYNPAMVEKLLDIYRVVHNYMEVGKDGQTPAMRLGLAKGVNTPEDMLYFTE